MSSDSTTTTTTTTVRRRPYWCYDCDARVLISTSSPTLHCPDCNGYYLQQHDSLISPNPNPNPNPNRPFISVFGPFTSQIPLHTSDYIDSDDDEQFNRIIDRIVADQEHHHHSLRSSPTSQSFIKSIPSVQITTTTSCSQSASISCSICKDEFATNEKANQLPCKHVFHRDCIVPWLNRSNSCPLCRYELPAEPKSSPLMRYVVRWGNVYVEGWGEDYQSGYWDALRRNGLSIQISPSWIQESSSPTQLGQAETGSAGPANSGDTVSSPSVERESDVDGAASVGVLVDEDGDTVMSDARESLWD